MSRFALLIASALFMQFLDGTIITTALPSMTASFGTAQGRRVFVVTTVRTVP